MGAARARGGCPGLASGRTRGLAGVGLAILALLAGCSPASSTGTAAGAARGTVPPPAAAAAARVKCRPAPGLVMAGWTSGYTGRRMALC